MNNEINFSFIRNNYFEGKYLNADDFTSEQKYLNDKRRLINMFVLGEGILYGLNVIKTGDNRDDESISIKPGIAIDSSGREIIISEIKTVRLYDIEGFPRDNSYEGALYLGLKFHETKEDLDIAINNSNSENQQNNRKYRESYKLCFEKSIPELDLGIEENLNDVVVLFENEKVKLWHVISKNLRSDEMCEAAFICVKKDKETNIRVKYKVESRNFYFDADNNLDFELTENHGSTEFIKKYSLGHCDTRAKIQINNKNISLYIDGQIHDILEYEREIPFSETNKTESIINNYINSEKLIGSTIKRTKNPIYLAKIFIMNINSAYGIKPHILSVEKTIFSKFIFSLQMLGLIKSNKNVNIHNNGYGYQRKLDSCNLIEDNIPQDEDTVSNCTTGVVVFSLKKKRKYKDCTQLIDHKLGKGEVFIKVSLEESHKNYIAGTCNNDVLLYSGDYEVFKKTEAESNYPRMAIGTVLYPKQGKFRIGIEIFELIKVDEIKLRWWAYKFTNISPTPEDMSFNLMKSESLISI